MKFRFQNFIREPTWTHRQTDRPEKNCAIMYRDGDTNMRWEGKFNSRTDAQRRATSVLAEIDKGTYTRPSSLKFEQFSKEWLAGRRQVRWSTESGYGSLIKSQLIPRLGAPAYIAVRRSVENGVLLDPAVRDRSHDDSGARSS